MMWKGLEGRFMSYREVIYIRGGEKVANERGGKDFQALKRVMERVWK